MVFQSVEPAFHVALPAKLVLRAESKSNTTAVAIKKVCVAFLGKVDFMGLRLRKMHAPCQVKSGMRHATSEI